MVWSIDGVYIRFATKETSFFKQVGKHVTRNNPLNKGKRCGKERGN